MDPITSSPLDPDDASPLLTAVPLGSRVCIRGGWFEKMAGTYVGQSAGRRALVRVEVLGRAVLLEVNAPLLDPADGPC